MDVVSRFLDLSYVLLAYIYKWARVSLLLENVAENRQDSAIPPRLAPFGVGDPPCSTSSTCTTSSPPPPFPLVTLLSLPPFSLPLVCLSLYLSLPYSLFSPFNISLLTLMFFHNLARTFRGDSITPLHHTLSHTMT